MESVHVGLVPIVFVLVIHIHQNYQGMEQLQIGLDTTDIGQEFLLPGSSSSYLGMLRLRLVTSPSLLPKKLLRLLRMLPPRAGQPVFLQHLWLQMCLSHLLSCLL